MSNILLSGGKIEYTKDPKVCYEVVAGPVLVYIAPYENGKIGRRLLVGEVNEGAKIPSLFVQNELLGDWIFILSAFDLGELKILPDESSDEVKNTFADIIKLTVSEETSFEEEMIERYNLNLVKEEGHIFATAREQASAYEKSLSVIYNMFEKNRDTKNDAESTRNVLYDTVSYACHKKKIAIEPIERIKESAGRTFDLSDIARVSHFIIREVVLEEHWYKKDGKTLIGRLKESSQPVALVPIGPNRYSMYDAKKQTLTVVDEKIAEQIDDTAIMLYRTFPAKAMKTKDIFKFGIHECCVTDIVWFFVLSLLGTLIGLLLPYLNAQIYDVFIPMGAKQRVMEICMVVLACALGNICFTVVKNLMKFRSVKSMEYAVQSAVYDRLFTLPESFFNHYDSAELAMRTSTVSQIYNALSDVVLNTVISALFSFLYIRQMSKYAPKLVGCAVLMLLFTAALLIGIGFLQVKYERKKLKVDEKKDSIMFQLLTGISKIRIAGVEDRALYEYLQYHVESKKIENKKEHMANFVNSVAGSITILFSAVFYYMVIQTDLGISMGGFMGFISAFGSFAAAILSIATAFVGINNIKPAWELCKPILETLPETSEDAELPGDLNGDVEISNVSFRYSEEEPMVINNLSLKIKAGEYIGIVGASGCGKSTLLKLMLGFEKPILGRIYYDGKDIDNLDKRELRKKCGVVLQNGGLIAGSIYENIAITAPNVRLKRVKEVVEEVGLKDDIEKMPMGLHTVLSENSGTISGGQKQRILIARALVNKPKLIFFDEATSALDNVTQSMVSDNLMSLHATRVVIAHRLSTVINCDRIIVMDQGCIKEEGTYEELMAKKGLFYELAVRQIAE